MKTAPVKILLVDDHVMVIEGMKTILLTIPEVEVTATANNAADALIALKKTAVDIAFVDINMPGVGGIELCAKIKKEFPKVHVVALSTFVQRSYVSQMLAKGASGYLVKSADRKEIEEAIKAVMEGKMYFSSDISSSAGQLAGADEAPILTKREKEVLLLIAEGLPNKAIADKIFISTYTVDTHRKNLLSKFGVSNTALLIKKAGDFGLV